MHEVRIDDYIYICIRLFIILSSHLAGPSTVVGGWALDVKNARVVKDALVVNNALAV